MSDPASNSGSFDCDWRTLSGEQGSHSAKYGRSPKAPRKREAVTKGQAGTLFPLTPVGRRRAAYIAGSKPRTLKSAKKTLLIELPSWCVPRERGRERGPVSREYNARVHTHNTHLIHPHVDRGLQEGAVGH